MMGSFDLAIFDQTLWHYGRFELPISTVRGMNILGDHFSPILILLSPFRLLWHNAQVLLILQAFIVCSSVYFIYLILEKKLQNSLAAYLLSITTYFFLGLQYALDYDFHLVSLSVLPISILLYGLFNQKIKTYWLAILLLFLLKEDMAIIVFFIGLYQIVIQKKIKLGIITSVVAGGFFLLESQYLMPLFQDNTTVVKNYIDFYSLGESKEEIIRTVVTKPWLVGQSMFDAPEKINTFIQTHKAFGFLPLLSPFYLLTTAPIWMERFLSFTKTRWLFDQYYGISLTPFLVIGTAHTIKRLSKIFPVKILKMNTVLMMTLLIFLFSFVAMLSAHAPLTRLIHPEYYQLSEVEKSMHKAVSIIPDEVSVSAQQPFVSHLSGRSQIYWFPEHIDDSEYILVVNSRPSTPLNNEERNDYISTLAKDSSKELVFEENGIFVFKKIVL